MLCRKPWVKGFHPSMIALNVKDLQELLMSNRDISENCFNLGVRFQTAREYNTMKKRSTYIRKQLHIIPCLLSVDFSFTWRRKSDQLSSSSSWLFCNPVVKVKVKLQPGWLVDWLRVRRLMTSSSSSLWNGTPLSTKNIVLDEEDEKKNCWWTI